jgi:pilus assembly protein CpaE
MPRVLAIDDEPLFTRLITVALEPLGYDVESATDGESGIALALRSHPDLIITDVMMPDITGYEVIHRLRRELQFAHTPFLVLTSQSEMQDKIQAFEAGADDHVSKPFEVEDLLARVGALLRRAEQTKVEQQTVAQTPVEKARLIAVHSLRGGNGCSTLAVNLGIGLAGLWGKPTLLLDMVLTAGQVASMLNRPLKRTWADIAQIEPVELKPELLQSITTRHESGLYFIPAPTHSTEADGLKLESLRTSLKMLKGHYEYIVADLAHDFNKITVQALDAADVILLLIAPEMSSIRSAAAALDLYRRMAYPKEKIRLVLNNTFPRQGISREKIEAALSSPFSLTIPYAPDRLVEAINNGQPPLYARPDELISAVFEDFAFLLSKDYHKKIKPDIPSDGWRRVYKRFTQRRK